MYRAVDIIEGVQNYICNWVRVRKGEEVVLVADSMADELAVETTAAVATAQGANVQVIWVPYNPVPIQGAGRSVSGALQRADKYLRFNFATSHDKETQAAVMQYGLAFFGVASPTCAFFASEAARYPVELVLAMGKKIHQKLRQKPRAKFRLTHENGTDLRGECAAENFISDWHNPELDKWELPAVYPRPFPGSILGLWPEKGEGVVRFHAYAGIGLCDLLLTYKNNKCVKIEGPQAAKLQDMIRGIPLADELVEVMMGLHPRIRPEARIDQTPIPSEAERKAGNVHVAIGNRPWWATLMRRPRVEKNSHLDGMIVKPSLYVDDEPLILNGHNTVLDDPEIHELASQFGDPVKLLTELA